MADTETERDEIFRDQVLRRYATDTAAPASEPYDSELIWRLGRSRRRQRAVLISGVATLAAAALTVAVVQGLPSGDPDLGRPASEPSVTSPPESGSAPPSAADPALVDTRGTEVWDALYLTPGFVAVDVRESTLVLVWAGQVPADVVTRARAIAAPLDVAVDPAAAMSAAEMTTIAMSITPEQWTQFDIIALSPDPYLATLTITVEKGSPLLRAPDPAGVLKLSRVHVKVIEGTQAVG